MKSFPLESVLKVRENAKNRESMALAELERKELALRDEIAVLWDEIVRHDKIRRAGGPASDVSADQVYAEGLGKRHRQLHQDLAHIIARESAQRAVVVKAMQECKKLEILKEKWEERIRREEDRKENLEMDERARTQHIWKKFSA